jgi:hypothetical protein
VFKLACIAASVAGLLTLSGGTALAVGGEPEPGAAVLRDFACGFGTPEFAADGTGHVVLTPSGNVVMVCQAKIPVGPPTTVIVEDIGCRIPDPTDRLPFFQATSSHLVITPGGTAHFVCRFRAS